MYSRSKQAPASTPTATSSKSEKIWYSMGGVRTKSERGWTDGLNHSERASPFKITGSSE
jgi:hypothetical protein